MLAIPCSLLSACWAHLPDLEKPQTVILLARRAKEQGRCPTFLDLGPSDVLILMKGTHLGGGTECAQCSLVKIRALELKLWGGEIGEA